MTYQLATAKVWNGTAWVTAAGGSKPWWQTIASKAVSNSGLTGILVAASSTINTKGAWFQWIASTNADSDLLIVCGNTGSNGVDSSGLLDIGIGSAGAETVVIPNIAVGGHSAYPIMLPIKIPAGSRIAGRFQSVISSRTYQSWIQVLDTGTVASTPTSLDTMGTSTSTSMGTPLVNNTFVEVISSTTAAYKAIVMIPSLSASSAQNLAIVYELATGAAGFETVVGSFALYEASSEQVIPYIYAPNIISGTFPAGTRLSVRTSAGGGGQTDVCLIGIP